MSGNAQGEAPVPFPGRWRHDRGTFYEGAIVAGFPADDTEVSVLRNIQAVGYGR